MFHANLQQVPRKNSQLKDFNSWVLFLRLGAETEEEKAIADKYKDIYEILEAQNVNYSEITTFQGKQFFYKKFNHEMDKQPLFFVFNKHPLEYVSKEPFLVVEWGKWPNVNSLKNDLMRFVNFFSNKEFREKIAKAKNRGMWSIVLNFLRRHGFTLIKIGISLL